MTKPRQRSGGDERTRVWIRAIAWSGAAFYAVVGSWALVSPATFHRHVAPFDPLNVHFLRDSGAFGLGLMAMLVLALTTYRAALAAALLATGIASVAHDISHVVDRAAGGRPALDIPSLAILGVMLVVAGLVQHRDVTRESDGP